MLLSLVEQKLVTHPEQLRSSPFLNVVRVAQPLVFCVVCCLSLFVFFAPCLLDITLSVLRKILLMTLISSRFSYPIERLCIPAISILVLLLICSFVGMILRSSYYCSTNILSVRFSPI